MLFVFSLSFLSLSLLHLFLPFLRFLRFLSFLRFSRHLHQGFLDFLKDALQMYDTEIVIVSQCTFGSTDLSTYETGRRLVSLGVIDGRDMTKEAVVTKLAYLMVSGSLLHSFSPHITLSLSLSPFFVASLCFYCLFLTRPPTTLFFSNRVAACEESSSRRRWRQTFAEN